MVSRILYLSFLIAICSACGRSEKEERPAGILSPDSMVAVMCRVHLTEAAILQRQLGQDSLAREIAWSSYRQVFKTSGLDYDSFSKSFEYYRDRPEEFQKIYDRILIELGDKQATLTGRER